MTPYLKNGERMYIQISNTGAVVGSATIVIAHHPPRNQGYWVDITDCVNYCCSSTTSTSTTE